ncbi:MAG: glycosyltransferase family 9 protein [Kiritimatiellae bacterium]|nr:glycosyltransferase family 9 protein [Kiritimatiellia bacterium]
MTHRECYSVLPRDLGRVLILMNDHHLGNLAVTLPIIAAFGEYFEHPADLLVDQRFVPLAACLPRIGRVIGLSQVRGRRSLAEAWPFLSAVIRMRKARYDAVITLDRRIRAPSLALFSGAPRRVGWLEAKRTWLYTDRVSMAGTPDPIFDKMCVILKCIGHVGRPPLAVLRSTPESRARLDKALHDSGRTGGAPLVVMHTTAGFAYRAWPKDRFARVADELIRRGNADVCLIGAPAEREALEAVRAQMQERARAFLLTEPIDVLVALFERASLLVSSESGPMHVAALTRVPIVTVYGLTDVRRWGPVRGEGVKVLQGPLCTDCRPKECPRSYRCLLDIRVEDVMQAAESLLAPDTMAAASR